MSSNVQYVGLTDTNVARRDAVQAQRGECTVLHCTDNSGPLQWTTENVSGGWPITWAVCSFHYWHLDGGTACAKVNEDQPAGSRWLLMDDLETAGALTPTTWVSFSV
jgi:hypothetical protein